MLYPLVAHASKSIQPLYPTPKCELLTCPAVSHWWSGIFHVVSLGRYHKLDGAKESRQKREAAKILRENKAGFVRECELVVLKNRNGQTPADGIPLTFEPLASLFMEGEANQQDKPRRSL